MVDIILKGTKREKQQIDANSNVKNTEHEKLSEYQKS